MSAVPRVSALSTELERTHAFRLNVLVGYRRVQLPVTLSACRETQEHESDSFRSMFKGGILYCLTANLFEEGRARLFLVKGRQHHLTAHEVEATSSSLNR